MSLVLGLEHSCPWPREVLSSERLSLALASRGFVLGKAVLGLGLGFFLCPWPWPRALCPRLHLCSEFCSSRQNHSRPNSLENCGFGGKNKTQSFLKLFSGDTFLYLLNVFATAVAKTKQKYQKLWFNFSYCKPPELAG